MNKGSPYLDAKVLNKISGLTLKAKFIVEGFISGMHRSPYHGFSVEFSEHREYVPGDDIRYIDWKVYGKSDRYYVKQYEEETNLICHVLLDISESMEYRSGDFSKLEYGCLLAASLSYLILHQQDSVGLALFGNGVSRFIPPGSHPSHMAVLSSELESIRREPDTDVGRTLFDLANRVKKKGILFLISDLLDDPETVLHGLRHLRQNKHEVVVFHVLDRDEMEFPFQRMTRFLAMEGDSSVAVDPRALRKAYLEELNGFLKILRKGCLGAKIDYVPMHTRQLLDVALATYLATRSGRRSGGR
jgi:uncharacterized protein (DUF58 family)